MRSTLSFLAVTGLTLALAACGDDTTGAGGAGGGTSSQGGGAEGGGSTTSQGGGTADGGGGAGPADLATALCEAEIAHAEECEPDLVRPLEDCLADDDTICFGNFRPDVQQPLIDCLAARTCDESDDACYFEVGDADPTEGQAEYRDACAAKEAACPGAFSDDYCFITVFTTETYASMTPCFDLACDEAAACLEEAYGAVCGG